MAKKTIKKKIAEEAKTALKKKQKENPEELLREIGKAATLAWENTQEICKLNKRLDSIVEAIGKCKSIKGL